MLLTLARDYSFRNCENPTHTAAHPPLPPPPVTLRFLISMVSVLVEKLVLQANGHKRSAGEQLVVQAW